MRIYLNSPAYTNGGQYIEAGNTVGVGDAKGEITLERADELLTAERAIEVEEAGAVEGEA